MFRMGMVYGSLLLIIVCCLTGLLHAQTRSVDYKITTLAGGLYGEGVKATNVGINGPFGVYVSSITGGKVYFTDVSFGQVRYVDSNGISHLAAGSPTYHTGTATDNLTFGNDTLNMPHSVSFNSKGELFIAEFNATRVRKVYYNSTIGDYSMITVGGGGSSLASNISALSAKFNSPRCVVVSPKDEVYICDTANYLIRKIVNGSVYNVVGTGQPGSSADGTLAVNSKVTLVLSIAFHPSTGELYYSDFSNNAIKYVRNESVYTYATSTGPYGITFDANGNLYVAEYGSNKIVKFTNGNRTVIANNLGTLGFSGDGGLALDATINLPAGIALYGTNLYFADTANNRVRMINVETNIISTFAGDGTARYLGANTGTRSDVTFFRPETTFYNSQSDELFVADTLNHRVVKINSLTNINTSPFESIAGYTGISANDLVDGKLGNQTYLNYPYSVAQEETSGDVYIGTTNYVYKWGKKDQKMTIIAGSKSTLAGDGYQAIASQLSQPAGLTFSTSGDLYFCDSNNHAIRKIDSRGIITTLAGNGTAGFQDGDAASALFNTPAGLTLLPNGDLLIADFTNYRIRKYVASTKQVITIAGNSTMGYSGDGGLATKAVLNRPTGVYYNSTSGDILIADYFNFRIRKISNSTGIISTIAGTGINGYNGDGLSSTSTNMAPYGLAVHPISGELYFTDNANYLVRRIDANSKVYTVVGVASRTTFSTSSLANSTGLGAISFLTFTPTGDLFISCYGQNVVKKMDYGSNIVYNIAGTGSTDLTEDGLAATFTNLNQPLAVAYSPVSNELYFSDYKHDRIRKITSSGVIQTIVGGLGDKGPALNAKIRGVSAMLLVDTDLYISDAFNYRIRKISLSTGIIDSIVGAYSSVYNGDLLANQTNINYVWDMRIQNNELVFSDMNNNRVRKTSLSGQGKVTTIAGMGNISIAIDNVKATETYLKNPGSIAFLPSGDLIIAETEGHVIRKVNLYGNISLIAGSFFQPGFNGDLSDAKTSLLYQPTGLTVLQDGRILFSDFGNNRLRMLTPYCKDANYYLTKSSEGIICNITSCNGIVYSDSKVCSGKGVCKSLNNCTCSSGYSGSDCSTADICSVLSSSYICTTTSVNTTETQVTTVQNVTQLDSKTIEFTTTTTVTVSLPSTISQYLTTVDSSLKNDTVTVVSSVSSTASTQTSEVVSAIVSIVLVKSSSSEKISVQNLEEPISLFFNRVNMTVSNVETLNVTCMYYDESDKVWKTDGVESEITEMILHNLDDGNVTLTISLTCKTYHLTSFGIIDQNYKKANTDTNTDDSTILTDYSVLIGAIVGGVGGLCVIATIIVLIIVVIILIRRREKK